MLGALYVDAFVCGICDLVTFIRARTGCMRIECKHCNSIIQIEEDDTITPSNSSIIRDIEFWQK